MKLFLMLLSVELTACFFILGMIFMFCGVISIMEFIIFIIGFDIVWFVLLLILFLLTKKYCK